MVDINVALKQILEIDNSEEIQQLINNLTEREKRLLKMIPEEEFDFTKLCQFTNG